MLQRQTGIEGTLLDEQTVVSVTELTRVCGLSVEQVRLMVGEGVLQPVPQPIPQSGDDVQPEQWRFTGIEIRRARRALRLQHDLELNLPGTALALDLLEEIDHLRRRVRMLEQHLESISEVD